MSLAGPVILAVYLVVLLAKAVLARRYATRCPPVPVGDAAQVTILQPVTSGDPRLAEFLAHTLDVFPRSPIIWIADEDDPGALEVCASLQPVDAARPVRLLRTSPPPQAVNPKAWKLAAAEPHLGTAFVAVVDDDTRLTPAGLDALLDGLTGADLSTGLPCYLPGSNLPSNLIAQFVNNQSVLTYLPLLEFFPPVTINGMCYALRTDRLKTLGGFARIERLAADDLAMGQLVIAAGGRIHQTITPHFIATTVQGWRHYFQLMHRWFVFALLLVREQPRSRQALILAVHGSPPLLLWLGLLLGAVFPSWPALGGLVTLLAARAWLLRGVQQGFFDRAMHEPGLSLLSELLQPVHCLHAVFSRTVRWRKRDIRVRSNRDFSYV